LDQLLEINLSLLSKDENVSDEYKELEDLMETVSKICK
jgi:hypothetical protein